MFRRYVIYLWVLFVFILAELASRALGIRFADEMLWRLYQYQDARGHL